MAFQGDLRNIGLASVFQNLEQNVQTGTLRLERNRNRRYVFVQSGRIAGVSHGPGFATPLGEYLSRSGKVSDADIAEAERKRRKGTRLASALEKAGLAGSEAIRSAIAGFVEEELYELFTWPDGSFEFKEGPAPADIFDSEVRTAGLELDSSSIILEAARRIDEWERVNRVVGSLGEIYVVRREMREELEGLGDPRASRVAEFLDGKRDVASVIRDSGVGRFAVCQGLSRLISDRIVRPVSAEELRAQAERAESAHDLEEAARLLRKALELERNDVALRHKLAEILTEAGEKEEAASEYKVVANALLDGGKTGEAAKVLRKAVSLRPTDFAARERLFQVLSESGGKTVALEAGMALAGTYSQLGLTEKARSALEKMLELGPKDRLAIERKLVDSHLSLGDVKAGVAMLRRMARRFMKGRDFEEAASCYEEILKLDSRDEEARKRVAEIQAGVVERMLERRRALIRTGVMAAVSAPLLLIVVRELACRSSETDARLRAGRAAVGAAQTMGQARTLASGNRHGEAAEKYDASAGSFDQAIQILEEFRRDWGWTFASRSVGREVRLWREMQARALLAAAESLVDVGGFEDKRRAWKVYRRLSRVRMSDEEMAAIAELAKRRMEDLKDYRPDDEGSDAP